MDKHLLVYPNLKFCVTHNQDLILFQKDEASDGVLLHMYDINGRLNYIFPPPQCQHPERWLNLQEVNICGYHDIAVSCCHRECKEITLYHLTCGTSISAYRDNRKGRPAPGIMCQGEDSQLLAVDNARSTANLLQFQCFFREIQLVRIINLDQPPPDIMHYMSNNHGTSFIVLANIAKRTFGLFDLKGECTSWCKRWGQISQFLQPHAICSDGKGIIYIANGDNNKVLVLDRSNIKVLGVLHYRKAKEIWSVAWDEIKQKLIIYCNDRDGTTRIRHCKISLTYQARPRSTPRLDDSRESIDEQQKRKSKLIPSDLSDYQKQNIALGKAQKTTQLKELSIPSDLYFTKIEPRRTLSVPYDDTADMSKCTPSTSCPLPIEASKPYDELQSATITSSKEIDTDSDNSSDGETRVREMPSLKISHFSRYKHSRHRRHTVHRISTDPQDGCHYVISSDDEKGDVQTAGKLKNRSKPDPWNPTRSLSSHFGPYALSSLRRRYRHHGRSKTVPGENSEM